MRETDKEKRVNVRPLVVAALALGLGILCSFLSLFLGSVVFIIAACCLLCIVVMFVIFKTDRKKLFAFVAIVFVFLIGSGSAGIRISYAKSAKEYLTESEICGTVESFYKLEKSGYSIVFKHLSINGEQIRGKARALIYTKEEIDVGKKITINAKLLSRVKDFENKKSKYNNFNLSEIFSGVYYTAEVSGKIKVISDDSDLFDKLYLYVRNILRDNLSDESYPVACALVLGDTAYLKNEVIEIYRMAGIAHVFAVSGLHIGLFVAIFSFIAGKLSIKGWKKLLFVLIPAFVYSGICGFRPPAVRAFIMAATVILSDCVGFKRDRLSALSIAFIIILLWQPFYLFDVGFELSFLAVGGIIALTPSFKRGAKPLKGFGDSLSASLSATLGTLPVLTDMCGYISIISLFVNLVFVPVICICYQATVCFTLAALIENAIFNSATVSLFIPDVLLRFISYAVSLIDYSSFIIPARFSYLAIPYYFGFTFLTDYLNVSVKKRVLVVALCIIAMIFLSFLPV